MKRKILLACGVLLFAALTVFVIWWYMPTTFLKNTDPADVARIEVFNGTNGQRFVIEERADIEYIVAKISDVKMRKAEYSHVDGFVYSISFYAADGTRIDGFILNGSDSIRDGAVRYEVMYETEEDALSFDYIKGLEEAQRNHPTE